VAGNVGDPDLADDGQGALDPVDQVPLADLSTSLHPRCWIQSSRRGE
jgi:hypothetical protein